MAQHAVVYIPGPGDRVVHALCPVAASLEAATEENGGGISLSFLPYWSPARDAARETGHAGAAVVGPGAEGVSEGLLEAPGLNFVQFTGCWQDPGQVNALQERGLLVCNAGPALAPHVADHTIGLMLAALKAAGHTGPAAYVEGLTVGVVGMGNAGMAIARRIRALGGKVIYHDIRTAPQSFTTEIDARRMTLDRLLIEADVVTLHVSDTPHSRPLIGARELRLMKPGSVLVNMSHPGALIEDDVAAALDAGAPATVALGALEGSASGWGGPLAGRSEVVIDTTPATASDACASSVAGFVSDNLRRWARGEKPAAVMETVSWPPAGDPAFWSSRLYPRQSP